MHVQKYRYVIVQTVKQIDQPWVHNISITLKSLKYIHLTLYLKPPPLVAPPHTERSVLSPKHQHTSTLTPLSLVKSGPQHRSLSLCLSGMHTSLPSLSRSPAISLTQAHALCRVYISHTHKTSPPNVYLPSYVVLAHSPHTPPPLQTSTLCLLVHHSPLSISPTCGPAPALSPYTYMSWLFA